MWVTVEEIPCGWQMEDALWQGIGLHPAVEEKDNEKEKGFVETLFLTLLLFLT